MKKLLNKNTFYTQKKSINQGKTQLRRYTKNQIHTKIRAKPNFRFWRICGQKHIFYRLNFLFAQLWASFNKESPLTWCEMLGKNIFMIKIFKICSCAIKNENFLQELSDMSTIRQSMDRLGATKKLLRAVEVKGVEHKLRWSLNRSWWDLRIWLLQGLKKLV